MPEVRISAEPRTEFGKGAARRVRRADKVPAVLYGHGEATRHVALPGHELMIALKGGSNQLLTLDLGNGDTELALPRQVVRDPIRGFFQHLDLLLVRKGEKVFADVSVHLLGEAAPDTIIDRQTTAISIEADATDIPSAFELDIDGITAGQHFTAAQVTLPAGVVLHTDPETVIVQGLAQITAEQLEDELTPEDGSDLPVNDADEEPGEGDIVPDTESGEGGPTES